MSEFPGAPPIAGIGYRPKIWLHAGLFLATFLTATIAGSWAWEGLFDFNLPLRDLLDFARLAHGLTYASLLLLILGAHEMGHYFACRYYGVPATPPFFIPGPPMLIGTLGAVIRIRGAIPSRKALFDIAAAGPIAGFVIALPVLAVGVATATALPASHDLHGAALGPPLASWILERWFFGDATIQVGSVYGAAWVGMLVTSMNLFPVGQLDGGHALFAISPKAHRPAAFATIGAVLVLVVVQSIIFRAPSAYSLWLIVLIWLRDRHPRLIDESEPLGAGRRTVGVVLAVIFILSFIVTPLTLD
jgi:membrane-associated protease RseP (regulator of RpoE activity)